MPTKRTILASLSAAELRTAVDGYELHVDDRRVRAHLIDVLARSRRARIDEILQALKRDRLKEMCRALDLHDTGREKAEIVARLIGGAAKSQSGGMIPPRNAHRSATEKVNETNDESQRERHRARPERRDRRGNDGAVQPKQQKRGSGVETATNGNIGWIANYIWGIADDVLRDLYVRGKYRDVILPMTVLRRLDAVLEDTKQAVLDMKASLDKAGIVEQKQALRQASGQAFYNTSKFTLRDLRARANRQQLTADFVDYLDGYSSNVQDILENFEFRNQIPRL